jgi:hypothetical protein
VRRPPRKHLSLEHETGRSTGSSYRGIHPITGCSVRHCSS